MRKKKVLLHTDFCGAATGFGGFAKEILSYLYKTGKYELYHYACGVVDKNPIFDKYPWKCFGALPNNQHEINELNKDPNQARAASYGAYRIDQVVKEIEPDVYIGVQDFWGIDYVIDKPWFDKINSIINWTADSLPLLESAINKAPKIKNHYVWADFATKEFHRLGFNNVKTLRGTVNTNTFKKLSDSKKAELRKKHGLNKETFLIGSLSRNQLRKLFPNLIEGFKLFKFRNPKIDTKLLLFTHWSEGWNLERLIKEFDLNPEDVLACYKCRATQDYFVMPFKGQDIDNPKTGNKKSLVTVNLGDFLTTEQVNEWYNLLDLFILPITSGGQERALQEAKLVELVTLVNPYSCGEDNCVKEAQSIDLEYTEYREIGTQFRKATVSPNEIAKKLLKAYNLSEEKRQEMGAKARQWVLENFSIEVIGKQYEDLIDSLPEVDYDFETMEWKPRNPNYPMPQQTDNREWLKDMYLNILCMKVDDSDDGLSHWLKRLEDNMPRESIYQYFCQVANKENLEKQTVTIDDFLDKDDSGRRILFIMPRSIGDIILCTSYFKAIKETYPDCNLYFATESKYFEVLDGNPYIHKCIPYIPQMDNTLWLEGAGSHKGWFEIVYNPYIHSQRLISYVHNGAIRDKLCYDIYEDRNDFKNENRIQILETK